MQGRNVVVLAIAMVLGLVAVFVANAYFSGIESKQAKVAEEQQLARIVVATQDIPFGRSLNLQNIGLVAWPRSAMPHGAFTTIEQALRGNPVAIRPMVAGEPVLGAKLSGRATLSANLPEGQVAYSIPVSETAGVAGFVRPGDVVDVLLTRQIPGSTAGNTDKMTDVVLSAVRVLAIDTVSDEDRTDPAVGRTATVQVNTLGAQKLALSTQLGVLTLALRNVADRTVMDTSTVLPAQLGGRGIAIRPREPAAAPVPAQRLLTVGPPAAVTGVTSRSKPHKAVPTMTIVRGAQPSDYEVQRAN